MKTHGTDRILDYLELWLVEGKFYTIFSILFGVGFSILLVRSSAKGLVFHRFFLRRVFFLFLIGAAHALLFWHDDILQAYALCGALLLPFVARRTRTILVFALLALLAPIWIKLVGGIPSGFFTDAQNALFDRFGFTRDTIIETWTRGGPGEIVRLNLCKWFSQVSFLTTSGMIFQIYGCFLLGFCLGRNEVHQKLERCRPLLRRIAIGGLAIGLPLNFCFAVSYSSASWLKAVSATFGILPLSAGYTSLLCLIWLNSRGRGAVGSLRSGRSNGADELRWAKCHLHAGFLRNRTRTRGHDGADTVLYQSVSRCMGYKFWPAGGGSIASASDLWSGCGAC